MTKELLKRQVSFFANLSHPQLVNGKWEKSKYGKNKDALPVFNGEFTQLGFIPQSAQDNDFIANESDIEKAMKLANQWQMALKNGECYFGLASEGDLNWFPFVLPKTSFTQQSDSAQAFGATQPIEVASAYDQKKINASYSKVIEVSSLENRVCVFWQNNQEGMMAENKSSFEAYLKVSDEMKNTLDNIQLIQFYTDYVEFPVAIMGKHKESGIWMGLVTSVVWT